MIGGAGSAAQFRQGEAMDGYVAVISKREVREYRNEPLPERAVERILQAGRLAGSSRNRQPWLFVLVTDRDHLNQLAEALYSPDNLRGCAAAVAVVTPSAAQAFDAGRAAQNMMIAAWADGVGSCPNGVRDQGLAHALLEVPPDHLVHTIISFGYPRSRSTLPERSVEEIWRRADRKPLEAMVRRT